MGFKNWAKDKKEKAGKWIKEKKEYYSLEERMKRKFAKQDLKDAEKKANAGKPKEPGRLKKAGLGILAAGGAALAWIRSKNKTKIDMGYHRSSGFSVNWMIGLAILYYLAIYVVMPVTDYYIRFSYNVILITLIWVTVLDESEKNGDTLRKLLFIGVFGEIIVPLLLNKYLPDFAFVVYLLPWWLYYAVLQRGKGTTGFSKICYFILILYLIGSMFLLLPLLLGIGTSGGLGSGLLFGGDGGGLLGPGGADGQGGLGVGGENPLSPLGKVLGTEDTVIGSEQQKDQAKKIYQAAFQWWLQQLVLIKNTIFNVENFTKRRINEATGAEYYTGKVEENKNLPLGVYLINVKPTDTEFDYDEQYASVYGTIQTRTLDDPVTIKPECYAGSKEYTGSSDKLMFVPGYVKPSNHFTVYDLDEEDVDCNIPISAATQGLLTMQQGGGSYKVTMAAEFNYETIAYLKTYFIDEGRLQSMRRANLDPFVVFAIKDKQPTAVFTPGPVKLGVGSKKPPIGVSNGQSGAEDTGFRLGVTVDNNLGWKGKIKKINELVIYPPVGVSLDLASCTHTFVQYTIESCKKNYIDQITVNSLFKTKALQECIDDNTQTKKDKSADSNQGISQCIQQICEDEFKVEDKTVEAYSLAVNELSSVVLEDIKNYKTFGCRAIVKDRDAVDLKNTHL